MKSRLAFHLAAAASLSLVACAGLFVAALSLMPALVGKTPAVVVSPVEQALCALDPDGSAAILAAGDSRALYHIVPSVIEEATGRKTVNIAQWMYLGGDPVSLVNALRRHPEALANHPVILLSVTLDYANDLGFKGVPIVDLMNWTPRDHLRTLFKRPRAYPKYFFGDLLPAAATAAKRSLRGEAFACGDDFTPGRLAKDRGFTSIEGRKALTYHYPERASDYLIDGAQWGALGKALAWLDASPAKEIILLNSPIDAAWLRATDGPVAMEMEDRFSDLLAREAPRHAKVTLWDFYRHPLPEMADSLFHDQLHLNREGAFVFSRRLGQLIAKSYAVTP